MHAQPRNGASFNPFILGDINLKFDESDMQIFLYASAHI